MQTFLRYCKIFGIFTGVLLYIERKFKSIFKYQDNSSFSQTGEDLIISFYLPFDNGYYVDVGCNHPIKCSNTFRLYKMGWRGINIDANGALIDLHKKLKKQDISIHAAISHQSEDLIFTEFEEPLISSLSAEHVLAWKSNNKIKSERIVKTQTLADIFEKHHVPHKFDLLCIDVEGYDLKVLSSFDLSVYRPTLIVIEMHNLDLRSLDANEVYSYMMKHNYTLVAYATMNGYFLDAMSSS